MITCELELHPGSPAQCHTRTSGCEHESSPTPAGAAAELPFGELFTKFS